jgi:phosphoribosylaminoimidazolecarboxamide formyltransferase/IMP cyclohydrolase
MASLPIRRALISVSDKTGLEALGRALHELGVVMVSTGGTRQALLKAGVPATDLSAVTHFPEILDGRVKTLHPAIHAGILARHNDPAHQATLAHHQIEAFQLVVCNLYPFERSVAEAGRSEEDIVENIDIGGPTLVRAAAKNFHSVAILCAPAQYDEFRLELLAGGGEISLTTRRRLAEAAFERVAAYDRAIADWFAPKDAATDRFPTELHLRFARRSRLRYGENPHQAAALYVDPRLEPPNLARGELLHGKELSFNNLLDLDSALALVRDFSVPAAVIIKHNNPCGVALGATQAEAYARAHEGDPLSAYGGVVGFNREVDAATADLLAGPNRFVEAIAAPGFSQEALAILTGKPKWKGSVRLVAVGALRLPRAEWDYRRIDGGLLVQTTDVAEVDWRQAKVVTQKAPTADELADLALAWKVCRQVKSNAIVLAKGGMVVGVGAGQMSRVDAVEIAIRKAGARAKGSVLASDAFFPFRDNIDVAAKAGIAALAQPGGSVRDAEVMAACDEHGMAMVFTGLRHFRH